MPMMTSEERIAGIVKERYRKLADAQDDLIQEVNTYYEMYRSRMDFSDAYPWDYQLVDPMVFSLLRNMMARLNPDGFRVDLQARNSAAFQNVKPNQQIVNWELSEMNKTLVFYRCIFRGLLAGRGYLKTGWKYEPAVEVLADGGRRVVMRDIVNRGHAVNVSFKDLLGPNRNCPDLDEQPYLIERLDLRFGDMLDDNKNKDKKVWKEKYLKKIKDGRLFTIKSDYGFDLPTDDINFKEFTKEETFLRSQYVSLLRMQTKEGEEFYTLEHEGEGWLLNEDTACKHWHGHYDYLSWAPFPEDEEFFSSGIVQPVADLEVAISSTLNQLLTNARKSGNGMWVLGQDGAKVPDWMLVNRPDGVVRYPGDVNQIKQIVPADTSKTLVNLRSELNTSFEKTTSMSSLYTSGVSSGTQVNKTATGARVIDANIDLNMQLLVSLMGAQLLSRLGEHLLELNGQYITEEQEIKITGQDGNYDFVRVRPEEITANFDVVANPDTITKTNPLMKQASLLNLKATMDSEKNVRLDAKPVWKAILSTYHEVDNVGDIIIDPEQQAQDAIDALLKGIVPKVSYNMDHKVIRQIVQVYLLSNQDSLSDQQVMDFTAYVDELTKWIDSATQVVTLNQPEPSPLPTDAGALGGEMLPLDDQALLESLVPPSNPTLEQPNPIPLDQMGGI